MLGRGDCVFAQDSDPQEEAKFSNLPVHFESQEEETDRAVPQLQMMSESRRKPTLVDASTQYLDCSLLFSSDYPAPPPGKVDSGCQYNPLDISHIYPSTGTSDLTAIFRNCDLQTLVPFDDCKGTAAKGSLNSDWFELPLTASHGHSGVVENSAFRLSSSSGHLRNEDIPAGSQLVKPYQCPECDASFTRVDHLSRHLKTQRWHFQTAMADKTSGQSESPTQYHACPHCNKMFTRRDHMKRHSKIHARGEPVKCVECLMWFPGKTELNRHLLDVHHIQVFECSYCSKGFSQAEYLTRHLREKHNILDDADEFKQQVSSDEKTPSLQALMAPYTCGICSLRFEGELECTSHMLLHLQTGPSPVNPLTLPVNQHPASRTTAMSPSLSFLSCANGPSPLLNNSQQLSKKDISFARNTGKEQFHLHPHSGFSGQEIKTEPLGAQCAFIGKPDCRTNGKADPVNRESVQINRNNYSKGFQGGLIGGKPSHSLIHAMAQQAGKPFLCGVCGLGFARPPALKLHLRRHVGHRPFACRQCGASFGSSSNLIRHQRIHSGERPYKCNQCPGAFTHKGALVNHERIHTGQRPYVCDLCGAAFARCDALSRHKKTHKEYRIKQEQAAAGDDLFGLHC